MTPLATIVLCAGKGTRMKSRRGRAKVLMPVLGKPLAWYPIQAAAEVGSLLTAVVVGHQAEAVQAELTRALPGVPLRFALQAEQRGTADAVRVARPALSEFSGEVLILYGDVPLVRPAFLRELLDGHHQAHAALSFVTFRPASPAGYGRVIRNQSRPVRIVEDKDANPADREVGECNAGIYLANSAFLFEALETITPSNAQGEYYLTDLVSAAVKAQHPVTTLEAPAEDVAGVNDRVELSQVTRVLQGRINRAWQLAGVTLLDPPSTWIEVGVQLSPDVELGPGVVVSGRTVVGEGTRIGVGCVISDSEVADDVVLRPYSVLEEAKVGIECQIGPFSRLRPGTHLEDDVHLGNFVETKKAHLGTRTKANHLSYLGDAEIGSGVNVGAGTITCNYDGVHKHLTRLGDGVFIGSDTQLVAPVSVGAGAYIGAGSTITEDVPGGALALSRSPQVIKEGWVEKKKAQKK